MKNQLALLTLCLFFSGFSLLAQPLSGDYTIGGPAPDYPTFTDAVDALISNGVDGPVLFTIADGTYSEQISIPEITGASSANTITFLGNGIFTSLLFTGSFSQRAGIELNGADHIVLDNLQIHATDQYGWCIHLHNGADNNTIRNCILVAEGVIQNEDAAIVGSNSTTNTAVAGDVADSLVIENNHLDGGWNAIELYSSGNAYLRINGNTINNFGRWATRIVGFNDFTYNDNDLYSNTDGSVSDHLFGLTALNCANPGRINGNHILLNHLKRISGISLNNTSGTVDDKILIANNAVIIIGETNEVQVRAFALQGTSGQVKFYHNSASINTDPSSRALIMEANNSGGVELVNNIFANFGLGLALDIGDPTDVVLSDHNDFFNLSGELVLWGGNTYTSLTSYQSASGFDVHSLAVNPEFANVESNLHAESLVMDNAGIPVPEVSDDFDGQLRHPATPDMGADEFFFDSLDVVNLQLIQPVTGMSPEGSAEVRVLLAHFQLKSVTDIPVAYTINNGPPVFDTIGLLLPNSTVEFAFGTPADLSAEGTYQVMVYSDYWNDTDRSNDTIYQNIQVCDLSIDLGGDVTVKESDGIFTIDAGAGFASYLWQDGSTGQTFQIDPIGIFGNDTLQVILKVTDNLGCQATDTLTVFLIDDLTGVFSRNEPVRVFISPNPSAGPVALEIQGATGKMTYQLLDTQGRVVEEGAYTGPGPMDLDWSGFPSGVYFIRLRSETGESYRRPVILGR